MVLLDVLSQLHGLKLIVAHFDHGIRPDSNEDEELVHQLAEQYGLMYVSQRVELGASASEATARAARYDFLNKVVDECSADKLVTAHHQDDLIETIILNILRGTGRRGLDPLLSNNDILRPLLSYSKRQIIDYAKSRELRWHEDTTNADMKYRRNKIRHEVMPKLLQARPELLKLNTVAHANNEEIDLLLKKLDSYLLSPNSGLVRCRFVLLPHKVAAEYMHSWLLSRGVNNIDAHVVNRATIAAKTLARGKKIDLKNGSWLHSGTTSLDIFPK